MTTSAKIPGRPVGAKVIGLAAAVAAVGVIAGVGPDAVDAIRARSQGFAGSSDTAAFEIGGSAVDVLAPGGEAPLDLVLANTTASDLIIRQLRVTVRAVHVPKIDGSHPCSVADFAIRPIGPAGSALRLPAKSRRTLSGLGLPRAAWPAVLMLDRSVNQVGCLDARVTLAYAGSGTPVTP